MLDWLSGKAQIESLLWVNSISVPVFLVIAVFIISLTILLYRRTPRMPVWVRSVLIVSRFVFLCLLMTILFEPMISMKKTENVKKRLPIMIDVSQSMSIKDQRKRDQDIAEAAVALGQTEAVNIKDSKRAVSKLTGNQRQEIATASRLGLTKSLLTKSGNSTLQAMEKDLDISYYTFGQSLNMLKHNDSGVSKSLSGLKAIESKTSIAESLNSLASTGRGHPLAGIVLFTDGLDTSLRNTESAISELAEHGVPIYTIPVGLSDPDDVSVRNVIIQEVAFSGDKVPVRVQIKSKGYEKRAATLKLKLNGRPMSQKSVVLEGGLQFEDIFFHVDIYEKGAAKVEISVSSFNDEATEENNVIERSVRVVNDKINVLCIEGSARWEFRYLRAMLKRDPRIKATFIASKAKPEMARNSSEYIERFPELREEAFQYDLVILGDVDAKFFTNEEMNLLEELIKDRGGSLLVLCGSRYTPTSYQGTVIEKMLPVEFEAGAEWEDIDDSVYPVLTQEGKSSLVMTLETDEELNDRIWTRVSPMDQLPPIHSPKPGATVLSELSDSSSRNEPYPLVSWQRYGTGKCMAIATDRMWLLRFKLGDKYHWRAWSQSIQFLTLSRLMGEHKRIRLETDRNSYQNGERVHVYAHVLDDTFNPESRSGFAVEIVSMEENNPLTTRINLVPNVKKPGLYEGYFTRPFPGRFQLKSNQDDVDYSNSTEFQITNLNPEMAMTDMQYGRMKRIAEISGGEVLSLSQFNQLTSIVNKKPHVSTIHFDLPLWQGAWLPLLVMGLMGFEWILRRKYDMP